MHGGTVARRGGARPAENLKGADHWAFKAPARVPLFRRFGIQRASEIRLTRSSSRTAEREPPAVSRSRSADADPAGLLRPDRPAADAGGGRGVRLRLRPGCVRKAGRSAARLAALRRAVGPALARRRAVCGKQRVRDQHERPKRYALPRLGHQVAQRRQAVRPVRAGTDRRRCRWRRRGHRVHRGRTYDR